ncbi:nitroreductase [Mycobacterium colombiense]|uniref:Nitroreductase n=1 Tax=Mycobacterium colombiense TaxID=339268 RepID=A0A1A2RXA6_9MYCO|nr:nitroreductase family deazaflavin-dependent oxidoreductase [Mycobacterium colombiense]OBH56611.1 nitroreductase [Mycobacterium colombiense]
MSPKDHPNSAPGLPMLFPTWIDRLQMKYMNPVMRRVARFLPTFVVVNHLGRKSGKPYRTVVNAYRKGNVVAILLGHGKTDWVKNLLAAGEGDLQFRSRDVHITNLRVLPTGTDGDGLPFVARLGLRRMGVLVADVA